MKKAILLFLMIFALTITVNVANAQQYIYGFSEAIVTGTDEGRTVTFEDPYTGDDRETFAGLMEGTIDGNPTKFYCIDIGRTISFPDSCHRDSAIANPKIVYILNNYYPYNPNPVGMLSDLDREVAATQLAIWHYSDGVNLNTITSSTVRTRALQIKADADANGTNTNVFSTLSIEPSLDPDAFFVKTLNQDGDPIAVNNIQLTISQGSLSTNSVNTNASGESPDVFVIGTGSGVITATANVVIPQGITYACPPNKQRLVIAEPTVGERRAVADWGALPVELSSFISNVSGSDVTLNWVTATELNNSGFSIERKISATSEWKVVGNVDGNGTTANPVTYSFVDRNLTSGSYNYRLKQIDYNGNFEYFELSNEVIVGTPSNFSLEQNYPNPFNPTTKIGFDLPKEGFVSLKVFDYLGRVVATLVNEFKNAGYYTVDFNGAGLTSGIYFYKIESNGQSKVMKMTLVK